MEFKKYLVPILIGGLISLTLIVCTFLISNGNFYIKNLGTSLEQDGKILNSISVNGEGKVFVKPDTLSFNVSVSETASTSEEALNQTNQKINSIIQSLLDLGIEQNDIQTSSVNIYTEYDYSGSNRRLVGQNATISLSVKVKGIGENTQKAAQAIDTVSRVSDVEISNIVFDLQDKTSAFAEARELAFQKAKQKAEELSQVGGVRLLSPVSISESSVDTSSPVYRNVAEASPILDSGGSTNIQSGQLELRINVEVVFGIE